MRAPELRQRLLVLNRSDVNSFRYDHRKSHVLADPFLTVVPIPLSPPWSEVAELKDLDRHQQLVPGKILVRNPWGEGRYVESGEIYEGFQLAKYTAIAHVCRALGAERLEASEMQATLTESKTPIKIGLDVPLDKDTAQKLVGAGVDVETVERVRAQLSQTYSWDGGPPNRARVEHWLSRTGLDTDPAVRGLVDQVLEEGQRLREYKLVASVSREAIGEISAVLELGKTLLKVLGSQIKIEIGHMRKTQLDVQVQLRVQFPQSGSASDDK